MKTVGIALLLLLAVLSCGVTAESGIDSIGYRELQVFTKLEVSSTFLIERGWFVSKIKDVISKISDRFLAFRNWIQTQFQHLLEMSKPLAEILKEMAIEFVKEMTRQAIESVIKAGYEYFREHQSEIGEHLWAAVEAVYRKYIEGHLQDRQMQDFSVEKFDSLVLAGCDVNYLLTEGFFLQSIKDLINSITERFRSFKDWIAKQMQNAWDVMQPHVDTLKEMALIFVKELAKITAEAVIEAGYEYFRERQNELGEAVWKLVEAAYRKYLEGKLQYYKLLQ